MNKRTDALNLQTQDLQTQDKKGDYDDEKAYYLNAAGGSDVHVTVRTGTRGTQ